MCVPSQKAGLGIAGPAAISSNGFQASQSKACGKAMPDLGEEMMGWNFVCFFACPSAVVYLNEFGRLPFIKIAFAPFDFVSTRFS